MYRVITRIIAIITVAAMLFLFVSCGSISDITTQNTNIPDKTKFDKVQKKLTDYFDKYYNDTFSGSILISSHGKILLSKGFGIANYEKGIPNTPDTSFNIASLTNQFTAMGIMILSDRGLLNIKDNIGKYIAGIDHGNEITIHHLLSQTSGIDDSIFEQDSIKNVTSGLTPVKKIEALNGKKFELDFEPGVATFCCNTNYLLLGYIIEKVSGESYEEFINKNIFKPLEMDNSGYYHEDVNDDNHAVGYSSLSPKPVKADMKGIEYAYAAGGLYSSVEDLYKWDQALYTDKLIKKQTLDKVFAKYTNSYGYGWYISDDKEGVIAQIEGVANGANTFIIRYIGKNQLIILLSNFEGGIVSSPIPYIESVLKELE